MAQFVVRNIEDEVKERLQRRALRHGRSMEEGKQPAAGLGTEIAALFAGIGLDADILEPRCGVREPDQQKARPSSRGARCCRLQEAAMLVATS
ncbi:MAG TPA: hypothetical protein VN754_11950 [Candidatus Binataceae bacterium]|nr:hypothetical protein [Candidatus Binataceae bacterium]